MNSIEIFVIQNSITIMNIDTFFAQKIETFSKMYNLQAEE